MPKSFYELEEAAALLGVSSGELEEMVAQEELSLVKVGSRRRLVRVRDVEAALARVKAGGRLRTKREFRGESVEEAVRRAAGVFGVGPEVLTYKVLVRGNPWAVGLRGSEARVLVDLPEGPEPGGSEGTAPPGGTGERRPGLREERSVPGVPAAEGGDREGVAGHYYAPEQAARLLGEDVRAVNLRVYRKELPTVDINGYLWIPKEAVDDLLRGLPAPRLQDPPRPFLIVRPPEGATNAEGLGSPIWRAMQREDPPPHVEPLEQKIAELEEHVKALQRELRLEKARQAQRLESELVDGGGNPSHAPGRNAEADDGRRRGDEAFDQTLFSP